MVCCNESFQNAPQFEPQSPSLSIGLQARDAFYASYITSKCWDFLNPYYHPTNSPEHLTMAIKAVGLAYLWHQVYSDAALATARRKYISALRMTNKTLKCSKSYQDVEDLITRNLQFTNQHKHTARKESKSFPAGMHYLPRRQTCPANNSLAIELYRRLYQ